VHPGHSVAEVKENTSFGFDLPAKVGETPLPSPETLALIRGPVGAAIAETYPRFAERVLGATPGASTTR
jgi:glutaconate CoA-transferase subunit B